LKNNKKALKALNSLIYDLIKNFENRNRNLFKFEENGNFKLFFIFIILVLILEILFTFFNSRRLKKNDYLFCPIRGMINVKKYDEKGYFTEEYHRIKLIRSLINLGISKNNIDLNYRIKIGHKGRNCFIPDAVVKKVNKNEVFLVVEVKKDSKFMDDAINYQLKPAMKMLDSEYGIYYDGTKKNAFFKKDGKIIRDFNFLEMPSWFFYEWKK
jgi:hypothetical protein